MSAERAFLDTNILIYLYSDTDISKREKAARTIGMYERFVSTQVLSEFSNVCIRKLKLPATSAKKAVLEIIDICNVVLIDDHTVTSALEYHDKYKYSFYDSLIITSALESGCQYLFSEDMSDGQLIDGRLAVRNIFK